jgi:hypothetical protein
MGDDNIDMGNDSIDMGDDSIDMGDPTHELFGHGREAVLVAILVHRPGRLRTFFSHVNLCTSKITEFDTGCIMKVVGTRRAQVAVDDVASTGTLFRG